jgi:hypothetical protein
MTCRLLVTEKDGQKLAATLTYSEGRISTLTEPGYGDALKEVLSRKHIVIAGERVVSLEEDFKIWFEALPNVYGGSYLRAEIMEEKP